MMDLVIVYDRIQILYPMPKFVGSLKINTMVLTGLLFTIVINIPINIGRRVVEVPFRIESNTTTILLAYGKV